MLGGPRIVDLEDVEAREVVRIEFEDGRSASIWERFLLPSPSMFTFYNKWDPGMISLRHGHQSDHVVYVLSGEIMVGDRMCKAGAHIYLVHGDRFGPWIAGPEGCELLGILKGPGVAAFWSEQDMQDYVDLLAKHGARQGEVPPLTNTEPWMNPPADMLPSPIKGE